MFKQVFKSSGQGFSYLHIASWRSANRSMASLEDIFWLCLDPDPHPMALLSPKNALQKHLGNTSMMHFGVMQGEGGLGANQKWLVALSQQPSRFLWEAKLKGIFYF